VASSLNTIEFALREFATGGGPRGLSLMLAALPAWIYGRDPIGELRFEAPLAALRAAAAADAGYFQRLIRLYLLDNPHRVGVHMYPDPAYNTRREATEAEALRRIAAGMTPAQVEALRADAAALLARQGTPDSPEAVATIPTLSVSDLPTAVKRIPKAVGVMELSSASSASAATPSSSASAVADAPWRVGLPPAGHAAHGTVQQHASRFLWAPSSSPAAVASAPEKTVTSSSSQQAAQQAQPVLLPEYLQHEQPTNGVGYASLYFDVSRLQPRLLPLVPLFAWALTSCGTAARDEVRLAHAVGMHTGGLGASTSVMEVPGTRAAALPLLVVSGKALASQAGRLGELLLEVLTTGRLDVRDRLLSHVREAVAGHEAALVSSGGRYASSLLSAQFTKGGWIGEVWGGLTSLAAARTLAHRITTGADGGFDGLAADLQAIRAGLLSSSNVLVSAIGDAPSLGALDGALKGLLGGLPAAGTGDGLLPLRSGAPPRRADGWSWSPVDGAAPWAPPAADAPAHERALPLWPFAPGVIAGNGGGASEGGGSAPPPARVALVVPTQVNYVVKAGPGYATPPAGDAAAAAASASGRRGGPVPGSAEVLSGFLRTGYLWEKVRVQGGAYGGGASLSRHSGMLGFSSYRDPNLGATLGVFDGTPAHLRGLLQDAAASGGSAAALAGELDKAVISTVGALDAPMAPAERGDVSTARHLIGITAEQLQARRDEILGTRPGDIAHFADAAQRVADHGRVAVVTSEVSGCVSCVGVADPQRATCSNAKGWP
jgi:presequence protease